MCELHAQLACAQLPLLQCLQDSVWQTDRLFSQPGLSDTALPASNLPRTSALQSVCLHLPPDRHPASSWQAPCQTCHQHQQQHHLRDSRSGKSTSMAQHSTAQHSTSGKAETMAQQLHSFGGFRDLGPRCAVTAYAIRNVTKRGTAQQVTDSSSTIPFPTACAAGFSHCQNKRMAVKWHTRHAEHSQSRIGGHHPHRCQGATTVLLQVDDRFVMHPIQCTQHFTWAHCGV